MNQKRFLRIEVASTCFLFLAMSVLLSSTAIAQSGYDLAVGEWTHPTSGTGPPSHYLRIKDDGTIDMRRMEDGQPVDDNPTVGTWELSEEGDDDEDRQFVVIAVKWEGHDTADPVRMTMIDEDENGNERLAVGWNEEEIRTWTRVTVEDDE